MGFIPSDFERYIDSRTATLILLVVAIAPMIVFSFLEPSLGLVAFCLLMWATMPWAYRKEVDDTVSADYDALKKQKASKLEVQNAVQPYFWLRRGTRYFFFAGAFYLFDAILEVLNQAFPQTVPYSYGMAFWAGSFFLLIAMFDSYRVVDYVLWEEVPEITGLSLSFLVIWLVGLAVVESVDSIVAYPVVLGLSAFGWRGIVYVASVFLSWVGAVFVILFRYDEWTVRKRVGYGLMTLPWITLGLWLTGILPVAL